MTRPLRFQFSIRSMLGFTALVALVLGLGKWIGPDETAGLVFVVSLLLLFGLAIACLDVEVVIGGTVGVFAVIGTTFYFAAPAGPASFDRSLLLAGTILGAMCGDVMRDARLARSLRRGNGKSILQALPFSLPERWMQRTALIGAGVMVGVLVVLVCAGVCLLPPTGGWDLAADIWHDCVTPHEERWPRLYSSVYSFGHILGCAFSVWPVLGFSAFAVFASVLVHISPCKQLSQDRCLWRVGMAHTLAGLMFSVETLQCLNASFGCSVHSFRPAQILEAMIWSSAYLPVNVILLALSVCILGRHIGRYFRLCGWLLALAFAAAVNAVVVAVGTALLMLW